METLTTLLTRERLLAELVVFKLLGLRALLQAGEARFLGWAAEEVERATTALREVELERAVVVAGLLDERGLTDPAAPLDVLVADAPEPWRSVLLEQSGRLRALCLEARDLSVATGRLAETGLRGVEQLLDGPAAGPAGAPARNDLGLYGPNGRRESRLPRARVAQSL